MALVGLGLSGLAVVIVALAAAPASAAPTVAILAPSEVATIDSGTVVLTLDIRNITMNGTAIGGVAVAGEGHYHIYLDGTYQRPDFESETFLSNVNQGAHTVRIELSENDHTEIGANDTVNFTVATGAPRVRITSPAASSTINSSSVDVAFTISNFTMSDLHIGGVPVTGEGHWHLVVDGAYVTLGTSLSTTVTRLTPGTHRIEILLVQNDHTNLTWTSFDAVKVNIPQGGRGVRILDPTATTTLGRYVPALTVEVWNFSIVNKPGAASVVGEGHFHVFVDGAFYGMSYGPSTAVDGLSQGTHTIKVALVNNDHSFLSPGVVDEVTVTVGGLRPTVAIVSPLEGAIAYGGAVNVSVAITNFTLAPGKIGLAALNGEGHWHVFIDGNYSGLAATSAISLAGIAPGDHVVTAELRNNDHTPLAVPIWDSITIHLAAPPTVRIITPSTGFETTDTSVTLSMEFTNFSLVTVGSTTVNAAGKGHYHVYVDTPLFVMAASSTVVVSGLTVGTHTIRVILVNNNHDPIPAGTNASQIQVTVKPVPAPAKGFLPGFDLAEVVVAVSLVGAAAALGRPRRPT